MVIPSTGQISFLDVQTEFGGDNPIILSEYYSDATTGYTSSLTEFPNIGEPISLSLFRGKQKLVIVQDYSWEYGSDGSYFIIISPSDTRAFGPNTYRQLGSPYTGYIWDKNYKLSLANIKQVSAAGWHTIYLTNDGTAYSAGYNLTGQLGRGGDTTTIQPVVGGSDVKFIHAGWINSVFVFNNGTAKTCGGNSYGELGNGTTAAAQTPVDVTGLSDIKQAFFSSYWAAYLKNDGTVYTVGAAYYKNRTVANSGFSGPRKLVEKIEGISNIAKIAFTQYGILMLTNDGTVIVQGHNNHGQLGNGTTSHIEIPVTISLSNVIDIAGTNSNSFFLLSNGTVKGCGENQNGNLGLGNTVPQSTPVEYPGVSNIISIKASNSFVSFLRNDEKILGPPLGGTSAGIDLIFPP